MTPAIETLKALASSFDLIEATDLNSLLTHAKETQEAINAAVIEMQRDPLPAIDYLIGCETQKAVNRLAGVYVTLEKGAPR